MTAVEDTQQGDEEAFNGGLAEADEGSGTDLGDILDAAVNSGIGRLVAVVTALSLPVFASLCACFQSGIFRSLK